MRSVSAITKTERSTEFEWPKAYARLYEEDSSVACFFNARLRIVFDALRDCEGGKVLDVGCGPGVLLKGLARTCRVVGLDISPRMVGECAATLGDSGAVLAGSADNLPFGTCSFDALVATGVLEYVADVAKALGEFARVTKKGGVVVFSMLNRASPYRIWEKTGWGWAQSLAGRLAGRPPLHREKTHLLSERRLRASAKSLGLNVAKVIYYDFNLFLSPLDVHMPQRALAANRLFEGLCRNRLKWIGTGFVVVTRKE